ncbi:MAG: type pilus assembly protein PilC [Patescibacteria group bacterium]|nr:type pilus assembly protein PilC [Patescibacteria group bacterium]
MKFKYKIFGQDTKIREGVIEESNRENVIQKLQSEGNIIIEVVEAPIDISNNIFDRFKNKITTKDLVISTRQLATLIGGGVQVLRAFRLLSTETESKALGHRYEIISDDVKAGMPVYKSLMRHSDVFDSFFISMVHTGEESGRLKEVLNYLADYIERNYELTQKTKKALTYPGFVIATFFVVMIIMTIFVIPKLSEMLTSQGQELPLMTKIIMSFSQFIIDYWWAVIPMLIIGAYYLTLYIKTPEGRAYFDTIKLKIPLLSKLYKKLYLSRFADNINTMISSGVPIVQSLQITSDVVDNYVFKKMFERVAEKVKDGKLLSIALADEEMIPNIMVQMTRIGEETGELGYMLSSIAKFYKRELEQTIDSTIALIEPIMIVVLGLSVGILMASILLPIYNIASSIQ